MTVQSRSRTAACERRWRQSAAAFLCAAWLTVAGAPAQVDSEVVAGWQQQMLDMRQLLLDEHWILVRNQARHLLREMADEVGPSGAGLAELFSVVSAQWAIAEAGLGNGPAAIWQLQIAQSIDPDFLDATFDEFGRAGIFLEGVRTVWRGPGGPRADAVPIAAASPAARLPRFAKGSYVEYRAPAAVLETWDRTLSVEFVIDVDGRVRAPVVRGEVEHVVPILLSLWTLESWRFEPGEIDGEPARFLYQVPLPITQRTVERLEGELGVVDAPVEVAAVEATDPQPDARPTVVLPRSEASSSADLAQALVGAGSAVASWARAWAAQDVDAYLAAYSPHFRPADGSTREAWAALREQRLEGPSFIEVALSEMESRQLDQGRVEVEFTQRYRSDSFSDEVRKTLVLAAEQGSWRIVSERSQ